MKILGIDPGTATTGFGVLTCETEIVVTEEFGLIETLKTDGTGERLVQIYKGISDLLEKHKPDVLAIERLFFFINAKTAMAVAESIGVIKLAAQDRKIKLISYAPAEIKLTVTGSGRADKEEMKKHVRKILNVRSPNMKKTHFDNSADALAVAICYLRKNMLLSGNKVSMNLKKNKLKKKPA